MKKFICPLLILISIYCDAQNKIKFFPKISAGLAYRLPVIELGTPFNSTKQPTYKQNSNKFYHCISLNADITQPIFTKRINAQLSGYIRYGHKLYDKNNLGISTYGENEKKVIKTDLFFDVLYLFKKKKENAWQFSIGGGYGLLNCGTKYKDTMVVNYNQTSTKIEVVKSYREAAPRVLLGMQKGNYNIFLTTYGVSTANNEGNPTLWIETKFNYNIWQLKK